MASASRQILWVRRAKPVVFALALIPAALLGWDAWRGALGAEPIETITKVTGEWALKFLFLTLMVTPLRRMTGWNPLVRMRRMLGLFSFFYACLHFLTYIGLDQFFAWSFILEDIAKRKYVLVGFTGFCLLLPLAVTSTNGMMRRLGGRRWQRLHRLVYFAAIAVVLHFLWLVKADLTEPLIYAAVLALLLGYRLRHRARTRADTPEARLQPAGGD